MPGGNGPGVAVVAADLAEPDAVLADPALREVIDLRAPVCVLACLVLHFWPAGEAAAIVSRYARLLAPGSVVAVSVLKVGDGTARERLAAVRPGLHDFSGPEFAALFAGLEVVPPGVGPARKLRPGQLNACGQKNAGPAYVLAGIGRTK
jgi:hypothetical protein